jgi:fused signal recognition particle receptor
MDMENKQGFFAKLKQGLSKTGGGMLSAIFSRQERVDDAFFDELEEAMIVADMGFATVEELLGRFREVVTREKIKERPAAKAELVRLLADAMRPETPFLEHQKNTVLLIVGVNGVGKTTSIGKLAHYYTQSGRKPLIAAADTFRAAAAEQLTVWAQRANVSIIKHGEGADPAAVVFDAIASFKAKQRDLLLCDTAGRLHNKKNLMNELEKIRRVISRELPDAHVESLLVLDATTGQNALLQAKAFDESTGLTGIILTKLDGTAKGGVAVAVKKELGLPVRFVGVGEGIDDLQPFDPDVFAEALV